MKLKPFIYSFFILASFFYIPTSLADQVYFDISHDRSLNISVEEGKNQLSVIGDEITILKKGRLWLSGNETSFGHQEILCQNLTDQPITLTLDSDINPWIKITNPQHCDAWNKDLLVCAVGDVSKGLFCKINNKSNLIHASVQSRQTASVSVRSVAVLPETQEKENFNYADYLKETIGDYSTGIELCGVMNDKKGPIEISWAIYDGGNTGDIEINTSSTTDQDMATAECIADQINFWRFPEWKKNFRVTYLF
ncbi:MAG: hypothetical protein ACU833_14305 [Gammaproteobacteria bacterium]